MSIQSDNFTDLQPLNSSILNLYTNPEAEESPAAQSQSTIDNKLRNVISDALSSYLKFAETSQKKQFRYFEAIQTDNNWLNQLIYTEAWARSSFYIQLHNFLLHINNRAEEVPENYTAVELEPFQADNLDEEKLLGFINYHSAHLRELLDKINPHKEVTESESLRSFEIRSKYLYHNVALAAFQFSFASQACMKTMQISQDLTILSSQYAATSNSSGTCPAAQAEFSAPESILIMRPRNKRNCSIVHAASPANTSKNTGGAAHAEASQSSSQASKDKTTKAKAYRHSFRAPTTHTKRDCGAASLASNKTREKTKKLATAFCKAFIKYGACNRRNCHFAHSKREIKKFDNKINRRCRFGKSCLRLTFCPFVHTKNELSYFKILLDKNGISA